MSNQFDEDNYEAEELKGLIDSGKVGYCEVWSHHDWSANIHGYRSLDAPGELVSCCDDCVEYLPAELVDPLARSGVSFEEILERIEMHAKEGDYSAELAARLRTAAAEQVAEQQGAGDKRGPMKLGPILKKSVEDALIELKSLEAESIEAGDEEPLYDELDVFVYNEIVPNVVPAGDDDIEPLLKDTPELLAYQIALDSLYPMEVVTPGWFIGEAAYRAVRDAVVQRRGH